MASHRSSLYPIGNTGLLYAYNEVKGLRNRPFSDNELIKILEEWGRPAFFANFYRSKGRFLRATTFYGKNIQLREAAMLHFQFRRYLLQVLRQTTLSADKQAVYSLFRQVKSNKHVARRGHQELKLKLTVHPDDKRHSWLRLYAVRVAGGNIIFTGGAIKLRKRLEEQTGLRKKVKRVNKIGKWLLTKSQNDRLSVDSDRVGTRQSGKIRRWEKYLDKQLSKPNARERAFVLAVELNHLLKEKEMDLKELAKTLHIKHKVIKKIVKGKQPLTRKKEKRIQAMLPQGTGNRRQVR